jgi:hypothetical protein
MSRDRLTFRQRDITAAIKAVKAAGEEVARIEVTHEGFVIHPGKPDDSAEPDLEFDRIVKERLAKANEQAASRRKQGKA